MTNFRATNAKPEELIDNAWKDYSLDAPRLPNPIPSHTQGLRRMCIVVNLALPLTKLIFGATNLQTCPTNGWMPIYLLVGGLLQLLLLLILIYRPLRQPVLLGVVGLMTLVWMIIGSINIFIEWKPDFFLGGWRYCSKSLFYFAFFVSVIEYIIFSVLILYVCTLFAYSSSNDSIVQSV